MTHTLGCLVLLALTGCGATALPEQAPAPQGPAAQPRSTSEGGRLAPLSARLSGPGAPAPGVPFELTARIERHAPLGAEVDVRLRLPSGVRLLEGRRATTLAPNSERDVHALRFVILAATLPETDVTLVVQARGRGFGIHAAQTYRFGRPPPETVTMPRAGSELRVGDRSFGRSVDLTRR